MSKTIQDESNNKKTVLIKNFGNDTKCSTLEELKGALSKKYKGLNISIQRKLESGILSCEYVTVQDDCSLIGTYSHKLVAYSVFELN